MPKLQPLATLSPEAYARLAQEPRNLMAYNQEMPQVDYDAPYAHQEYPKHLHRAVTRDGRRILQSCEVKDREQEEDKLTGSEGWKTDIQETGIITAPAAPEIPVSDVFEVPTG